MAVRDRERVRELVVGHGSRDKLGELCFDVLGRQASGRALYSGRKFMRARANKHGVTRAQATTDLGDVLKLLERGPKRPVEWALLSAFAVSGFSRALDRAADEGSRAQLAETFAGHADWLQLASDYVPYAFVDLLGDAHRSLFWEVLEVGLLEPPAEEPALDRFRARAALRLSALKRGEREGDEEARRRLRRLADQAPDPVVRAAAAALCRPVVQQPVAAGAADAAPETGFELGGRALPSRRVGPWRVAAWVSGVAGLIALGRLLGRALGVRRWLQVRLEGEALELVQELRVLGRPVRRSQTRTPVGQLTVMRRETRYPAWRLALGAAALLIGVGLGVKWLSVAFTRGEPLLGAAALIAVLGGGGLDLLLTSWWPAKGHRYALELRLSGERRTHRLEVSESEALDHFYATLAHPRGAP